MMKSKIILSAISALMLLSGCSSENDQQTQTADNNRLIPIMLSANSEAQSTRAGQELQNTQFKKGKSINVQITSQDNQTGYDLLTYFTSDNNGTMQPTRGVFPYYPVNKAKIDIRAIYPVENLSTNTMNASSFTVTPVSQDGDNSYMESDLMFAKVENLDPSDDAVVLNFQHLLTKIQVNLTKEGGVVLTGSTVKLLGVKTTTAFNPLTGEVTKEGASGTASDIVMTMDGADPSAAIIVPQVKESGFLLEIILANNDVLYYKTVQDIPFEGGKVYTFNVKVIESNISVATTVSDWTTTDDTEERLKLSD